MQLKHYITLQTLTPLHMGAVHELRQLAIDIVASSEADGVRRTTRQAVVACTAMRDTLANLLDLDEHELHCSIKLFDKDDNIRTWARSKPLDDRPPEMDVSRPLTDGTPWCALLGKDDGITHWREYRCFSCNDLVQAHSKGRLSIKRSDWQRYYKAALVYPLVYRRDIDRSEKVIFGFLCFDSPKVNVFIGMPDIFDSIDNDGWHQYHMRLKEKAPHHASAIMADTLSMFMRPYYETLRM